MLNPPVIPQLFKSEMKLTKKILNNPDAETVDFEFQKMIEEAHKSQLKLLRNENE